MTRSGVGTITLVVFGALLLSSGLSMGFSAGYTADSASAAGVNASERATAMDINWTDTSEPDPVTRWATRNVPGLNHDESVDRPPAYVRKTTRAALGFVLDISDAAGRWTYHNRWWFPRPAAQLTSLLPVVGVVGWAGLRAITAVQEARRR